MPKKKSKIYYGIDLGPGDGGKGGVVHKLCTTVHPHTVLKVGGCQGSHGVTTDNYGSFCFSHFGCGTLEGIRTHITQNMIIEPYRLLTEARQLQYEKGIHNVFNLMTIDKRALCVTPYHTFSSCLRELLRKDKPKGTVGIGVGEALRDSEIYPENAIYAKDLSNKERVFIILQKVRLQKLAEFYEVIHTKHLDEHILSSDIEEAKKLIKLFLDTELIERTVEKFFKISSLVQITDEEYFRQLLAREGNMVMEGSHGVLNDRLYGFYPHVTHLRILPQYNIAMLERHNYTGEIIKLGITRAYQIRHGAGPMPTHDRTMSDHLLPGSSKLDNRWQGKAMVGALDFNLLRYAVDVCGGPQFFNGLAVTWFDQILHNNTWNICESYQTSPNIHMDTPNKIRVFTGNSKDSSNYQKSLTEFLYEVIPEISTIDLRGKTKEESVDICTQTFQNQLGIPVRMISTGPTDDEKYLI